MAIIKDIWVFSLLNICLLIHIFHIIIHSYANLWSSCPYNKELFILSAFLCQLSKAWQVKDSYQKTATGFRSGSRPAARYCGDHSRKRTGLVGCPGPKNKISEGPSSLPKFSHQNHLPVIGTAFQEHMPSF